MAKNRDQVALTAGFHPRHAKTVISVVKRDALDQAGKDLGRANPWMRAPSWHHGDHDSGTLRQSSIHTHRINHLREGASVDPTGQKRGGFAKRLQLGFAVDAILAT